MNQEVVAFICNICEARGSVPAAALDRERRSCSACGSSVRMRAMVHLLSVNLFGESLAIESFPESKRITGIGLSDWPPYAKRLEEKLGYRNTYYHKEPRLDITRVPEAQQGSCDFIIATDVFEHVLSPVSDAFMGAHRLLKPGGFMVFSVPFRNKGEETIEHFHDLHEFRIENEEGLYRLVNRKPDGSIDTYTDLKFHGGPGETLEMRLFCRKSLVAEFERAGFEIEFFDTDVPERGIVWQQTWSTPLVARKRL